MACAEAGRHEDHVLLANEGHGSVLTTVGELLLFGVIRKCPKPGS